MKVQSENGGMHTMKKVKTLSNNTLKNTMKNGAHPGIPYDLCIRQYSSR